MKRRPTLRTPRCACPRHDRHRHRRAGVHPRRHRARQARQSIIDDELRRYRQDLNDQLRIVENDQFDRIEKLLVGKTVNGGPRKLAKGATITKAYRLIWTAGSGSTSAADEPHAVVLEQAKESLEQKRHQFDLAFEEKRKKLTQGDELPRRAQDDQGLRP